MLFDYCVCVHLSKAIVSYEPIITEEQKRNSPLYKHTHTQHYWQQLILRIEKQQQRADEWNNKRWRRAKQQKLAGWGSRRRFEPNMNNKVYKQTKKFINFYPNEKWYYFLGIFVVVVVFSLLVEIFIAYFWNTLRDWNLFVFLAALVMFRGIFCLISYHD